MRVGLLTASLSSMPVEAVIARVGSMGLAAVELAAWPLPLQRPFTAAHIGADGSAASVERLRPLLDEHGVDVAALAYYDNPLHPDASTRARVHEHLEAVIGLAAELGCRLVGTFVGRDPQRTVAENLADAERIFPRFVEHAAERGVRLMIENCPMHGWHPDGYPGNLAYSPELWEWMEQLGLWLNFDPSHLPTLGIDPLRALQSHLGRVVHVQAKDVVISSSARDRLSCHGQVLNRNDPWDTGWWSYRLPGEGEIDWTELLSTLSRAGFDGVVAIENEDLRGPGTPESILAGAERAAAFLNGVIAACDVPEPADD